MIKAATGRELTRRHQSATQPICNKQVAATQSSFDDGSLALWVSQTPVVATRTVVKKSFVSLWEVSNNEVKRNSATSLILPSVPLLYKLPTSR